jgi:hypothetical protein
VSCPGVNAARPPYWLLGSKWKLFGFHANSFLMYFREPCSLGRYTGKGSNVFLRNVGKSL